MYLLLSRRDMLLIPYTHCVESVQIYKLQHKKHSIFAFRDFI